MRSANVAHINDRTGIRLAERILTNARHICAFFHSKEEEYRVLMPFLREGLGRGEKVYTIIDPARHAPHQAAMEAAGIDVADAATRGQLQVWGWGEAYLQGGRFDMHRMLELVEKALIERDAQGYPLSRLTANMEWALTGEPGVEDLVEYEARANDLLAKYPDPVVCVYDLNKFGAGVAMDVLRTHPAVIIGGVLYENPFYVPPEQFLRELKQRRA